MKDRAALLLGLTFSQSGGLTPRELWLLYRRREAEAMQQADDMVVQAWWSGLFARAAFHAGEYPRNVEDFLPSLAEERARKEKEWKESWSVDDCKKAVGLM